MNAMSDVLVVHSVATRAYSLDEKSRSKSSRPQVAEDGAYGVTRPCTKDNSSTRTVVNSSRMRRPSAVRNLHQKRKGLTFTASTNLQRQRSLNTSLMWLMASLWAVLRSSSTTVATLTAASTPSVTTSMIHTYIRLLCSPAATLRPTRS